MKKLRSIVVKGTEIGVITFKEQDYISLTDMLKAKDAGFSYLIGLGTGIPLNSWVYGRVSIIRILIMADSP